MEHLGLCFRNPTLAGFFFANPQLAAEDPIISGTVEKISLFYQQ